MLDRVVLGIKSPKNWQKEVTSKLQNSVFDLLNPAQIQFEASVCDIEYRC